MRSVPLYAWLITEITVFAENRVLTFTAAWQVMSSVVQNYKR
jgi:hypothetical protein